MPSRDSRPAGHQSPEPGRFLPRRSLVVILMVLVREPVALEAGHADALRLVPAMRMQFLFSYCPDVCSSRRRSVADKSQCRLGVILVWDREGSAGTSEGGGRQSSPLRGCEPSHRLPLPVWAVSLVVSGLAPSSSRLAALRYCPALHAGVWQAASVVHVSEVGCLRRGGVIQRAHGRTLRVGIPLSEVVGDQIPFGSAVIVVDASSVRLLGASPGRERLGGHRSCWLSGREICLTIRQTRGQFYLGKEGMKGLLLFCPATPRKPGQQSYCRRRPLGAGGGS